MKEQIIPIAIPDPVSFFGINEGNINVLRQHFPNLKIIARGSELKAIGHEEDIDNFKAKIKLLVDYCKQQGELDENTVSRLISQENSESEASIPAAMNEVLVHGQNGIMVKARTANQRKIVESTLKNDIVFAIGPAGTGKTYTAVALAVRALKNKEVRRIILTRPAVEAGEHLGFLPGDLKEKIDPYLRPLYDALLDMIPGEKLKTYIESEVIEVAPLAFMRGRTLNHAYVILDEAQNATENQLKMFLTRLGPDAKLIVTGDITQVDLPLNQPSGVFQVMKILSPIKGIDFIYLDSQDVIRHKLVKDIIDAYDKISEKSEKRK